MVRQQKVGSVYQRKDGYYVAAVTRNGHRVTEYCHTKREANAKLAELVGKSQERTLGEWLDYWLGVAEIKPTTRLRYEGVCRVYIKPAVGHVPLRDMKPTHVLDAITRWKKTGAASGTVLNAYRVLHRALVLAEQWDEIERNPCDKVPAPRATRAEATVLSPAEGAQLLRAARNDRYYPLFAFLAGSGCRLGEALGLTWADLTDDGSVTIRRELVEARRERIVQDPKTKSSVRTVKLPDFALAALREWQAVQTKERERPGYQDARQAVFTTRLGSAPTETNLRRSLHALCDEAGLPRIRLHDLRHYHATLLIEAGLDPKSVQSRLGHSTIQMTMGLYAHASARRDGAAAAILDKLVQL